jgi:hypothetical protein
MIMRPIEPPVILDCGHIEIKNGYCATIDCPNFIDAPHTDSPRNIKAEAISIIASGALLIWVRVVTGRGALDILSDYLPSLS